jgi:N-acetylmuramoyl-L-alanine amidase
MRRSAPPSSARTTVHARALRHAISYGLLAVLLAACAAAAGAEHDAEEPAAAPSLGEQEPRADDPPDLLDDVVLDGKRDDEVPPARPGPPPAPAEPAKPSGSDDQPTSTPASPTPEPGEGGTSAGSPTPAPAPTAPTPTPTPAPAPKPPASPGSGSLGGRIIAVDPGHNGGNFDAPEVIARPVDAGGTTKPCNTTGTASDDGYRESTFNLELSRALKAELERRGATVKMTRTDDTGVGPCIDERGRFGGAVGAHAMVSIHADGAAASARGFHIIRPAGWSGQPASVVSASSSLATRMRDALVSTGLTPATYTGSNGIHPRSDIGTLNLSTVPAVLLEAGNMRNEQDLRLLRSSDGQRRIAVAIADALEAELG